MSEKGDIADRATELTARETADCIAAARTCAANLAGPDECRLCESWNDRAEAGYAVCSACVEG